MSLASPLGTTYGARLSAYLTTYDDFRKHRKRLNKSLLKLRHDLGLVSRDTKNYVEKTQALAPEQYDADDRHGLVLLLLAERDTIYALEIKSLIEISGERSALYKRLMVSKLKKAVGTCKRLLALAQNERSAMRKIELYVYAALASGLYASNRKHWPQALYAFSVARCGLEFLAARAGDDELSQTVVEELLDTLVDPSLNVAVGQESTALETTTDLRTIARKHCHDGTLRDLAPAVQLIAAQDELFVTELEEEETAKSVAWRGHEARIYNDELAAKIARLAKVDWRRFAESNDYDDVYSQWSALVDIHANDVAKNKDEDDMDKVQDGAVLLTYLKYNMLFTKLKRDLLLIDQLSAQKQPSVARVLHINSDVLRLYDAAIATVEDLKDLPGVYNDEGLFESLDNMATYFTVKKSVTVADSYAVTNKLPEALRIFIHLERTFSADGDLYQVDEFPYDVTSNKQAQQLRETIASRADKIHTLAQLNNEAAGLGSFVADDIYKFPLGADSLAKVTNVGQRGKIQPVLSKAVLFDIAFNYISYSGDADAVAKPSDDAQEKKKSGFFGLFGRS